jgi:threonyl-tRNA synthetase
LQGYSVSIDRSGDTLNKKVMNAQKESFNYIGVIGKEEVKERAINIRKRDEAKEMGKFSVPELVKLFETLRPLKSKRREELEAKSIPL